MSALQPRASNYTSRWEHSFTTKIGSKALLTWKMQFLVGKKLSDTSEWWKIFSLVRWRKKVLGINDYEVNFLILLCWHTTNFLRNISSHCPRLKNASPSISPLLWRDKLKAQNVKFFFFDFSMQKEIFLLPQMISSKVFDAFDCFRSMLIDLIGLRC